MVLQSLSDCGPGMARLGENVDVALRIDRNEGHFPSSACCLAIINGGIVCAPANI